MKRYHGSADRTVLVEAPEGAYPLPHQVRHSPSGFAWSYGGSGPADLARSLLWDHLGREPSAALYQDFKWDFVAKFDYTWSLAASDIDAAGARLEPMTPSGPFAVDLERPGVAVATPGSTR